MTVKELKEQLNNIPDDVKIFIQNDWGNIKSKVEKISYKKGQKSLKIHTLI